MNLTGTISSGNFSGNVKVNLNTPPPYMPDLTNITPYHTKTKYSLL